MVGWGLALGLVTGCAVRPPCTCISAAAATCMHVMHACIDACMLAATTATLLLAWLSAQRPVVQRCLL